MFHSRANYLDPISINDILDDKFTKIGVYKLMMQLYSPSQHCKSDFFIQLNLAASLEYDLCNICLVSHT